MWTTCLKFLLLCWMLLLVLWTQDTFLSSTGTLYSWNLSECSKTSDTFTSTSYTGAICMGTNKENSSWGYQFLFYDIGMYGIYKCHNYNVSAITCSLQLWFKAKILEFLRKTNNHWVCTMSDTMSSLDNWPNINCYNRGLPWWLCGKESICQCRRQGFDPLVGKILWRRKWQPTPVFLPGKSHGQRSLEDDSPRNHTT